MRKWKLNRRVTWLCTIWWTPICVSAVWCYKNHHSVKVEPSLCLERSNGTAPSQSEPCFVDCQWPCVLSQWTEWTSCIQACTTRTRTRQLIGKSCCVWGSKVWFHCFCYCYILMGSLFLCYALCFCIEPFKNTYVVWFELHVNYKPPTPK
jgi:hypothetical protein